MGFKLRTESLGPATNLEDLEKSKQAAADSGPASLQQFESQKLDSALKEEPPTESSTPSDNSSDSSNDSSSDDNGGDDSGGDDFGMGSGDSFNDGSSTGSPSDDSKVDEKDDKPVDGDEKPEEEPDEEPGKEEDDEAEIKTESIRRIDPLPTDLSIRFENSFLSSISEASIQAWSAFSFVVGVLAGVGIRFAPTILATMFKIVLYTFARVFQLLGTISDVCKQRIERYIHSHEKQKAKITALSETLKQKLEEGYTLPDNYGEFEFPATWLCRGGERPPIDVINEQKEFTSETFGKLLKITKNEFTMLEEIAKTRYLGKHFDALAYLQISPSKLGMKEVQGYIGEGVEGTAQASLGMMAGNVECVAFLPLPADNWNSVERNYNNAKFELMVRPEFASADTVAPLSPKELVRFIAAVDDLIEANAKHQLFYEELAKARSGVLTSVRALFINLVRSQTRISFKDSVALPLFLKTSLTTKVYLVAAMDIQDHNAKVIANALVYVDRVMKIYQKPVKEKVPSQWD